MSRILLATTTLTLAFWGIIFVYRLYLADQYFAQNEPISALKLNPFNPTFLINSAYFKAKNSQDPIAIDLAKTALMLSPADINFYKLQSQILSQLATTDVNYLKAAIKSLETAEAFAPTDATIPFQIAQLLQVVNRKDLAKTYYEKALKLKPNYDHAMLPLAEIYIEQRNYSNAVKLLQSCVDINPKNIAAKNLLEQIRGY